MNIAIFSPSQNAYSETFIQAHKNYLKGNVFYYFGVGFDKNLENTSRLVSKRISFLYKITKILLKKPSYFVKYKSLVYSLKKNRIEIVLVEYGSHANEVLSLIKETKIPMIVHFHGYDASVNDVVEKCGNYKEVFACAKSVIAVSKKMEDMLLQLGCPRDKLIYNVYGPQKEFEAVVPKFNKKQFIGIGRFTDKKAPYYTILAFKNVLNKHSDAQLVLAGKGELLNACENLVKYFKLENSIHFIGVITPKEFRNYLSESIAFVQHSIKASNGDMEGTPLAVLEASSAGIPVISTKHAGIPDIVLHKETGLLCNEHDVLAMENNMLQLLNNPEYGKQLGALGKARIEEYFSLERHIAVLQQVLVAAVNRN